MVIAAGVGGAHLPSLSSFMSNPSYSDKRTFYADIGAIEDGLNLTQIE